LAWKVQGLTCAHSAWGLLGQGLPLGSDQLGGDTVVKAAAVDIALHNLYATDLPRLDGALQLVNRGFFKGKNWVRHADAPSGHDRHQVAAG
jgi:hypothetical protein